MSTRLSNAIKFCSMIDHEIYPSKPRLTHVSKTFGLSPDDYLRLAVSQSGGCAICGAKMRPVTKPGKNQRAKYLAVDHDHVTGKVRGLLCSTCNSGIGMFKDNPDLLRLAASYLERTR